MEPSRRTQEGSPGGPLELNVAFIGPNGAGKSCLGGMIMEMTNSIPQRNLERIRKVFADYFGGRLFCPGWFLDVKRVERERGITFDGNICQASLENGNKIVIFDTPGHRSFWMKAINFICQSDAVVIALDSREPIDRRYSSRFMTIASYAYMFKVRQVIVAFTLFDLDGKFSSVEECQPFSESRFLSLQKSAREGLRKIGFKDEHIIGFVPTSTEHRGLNILTSTSSLMPWFQNQPSLVDLIQRCKPVVRKRDGPGIVQIQKLIAVGANGTILSGAVLRGQIRSDEFMLGIPSMRSTSIRSLQKFHVDVRTAYAGDTVGIALHGQLRPYEIRANFSGFLVSDSGKAPQVPPASSCFVLDAIIVKPRLGKRQRPLLGGAVTVTTRLGSVIGIITKIEAILSPKNFQPIEKDTSTISASVPSPPAHTFYSLTNFPNRGQLARIVLRCYSKLYVGDEENWPELSRVVLSDTISIVGAGVVRRLTNSALRVVNVVTICTYGQKGGVHHNGTTTETFNDVQVNCSWMSDEEISKETLRKVSIVKLVKSPRIKANSTQFKDLMKWVDAGGTLWVSPETSVEQIDLCNKFGMTYQQLPLTQPSLRFQQRVCTIPLAIAPRVKGEDKGPVRWSQLQKQWLDVAEREKKPAKSAGRKPHPHNDFLWLPNDCIMEIFRAVGRANLAALFRCSLLLSKSTSALFETSKDIWVEACSAIGGIPLEYLHGGASNLTDIERGSFSKLISSRYLQQLSRPQGDLVFGPFGKAATFNVRTEVELAIHQARSQQLFEQDGGIVLSRIKKNDVSQGVSFVHFRRYYNGRSGQVLFVVPGADLSEKFFRNLYLDASVCCQCEFASRGN